MLTETKTFEIHHYEIDLKKRALVSKIMNYFDDTAITQSEKTGLGLDVLGSRNLTWVLYQWNIKMHEYPAYRDIIKVWTAPTGFNGFYAYRKLSAYIMRMERRFPRPTRYGSSSIRLKKGQSKSLSMFMKRTGLHWKGESLSNILKSCPRTVRIIHPNILSGITT